MSKKKIGILFTTISLAATILLSGCSRQSEPSIAKTENINQAVVISNTNSVNTNVNLPSNEGQNNSAQNISNAAAPSVNDAPPVNKKSTPPAAANEPKAQIGTGGNDMFLVIQARSALSADKQLLDSVIVDSKEGNVVLTGKVASAADKVKAAQLVQGVKGVKSLKNNITVSQ